MKMTDNKDFEQWKDIREPEKSEDREFLNFEKGSIEVLFESNDFRTGENKFGNTQFYFDVRDNGGEKKVLGTSSKRLMAELKSHLPLKDKRLNIERLGSGFDTTYKITE